MVGAKHLAQSAFGACPLRRVTYRRTRCHHPNTRRHELKLLWGGILSRINGHLRFAYSCRYRRRGLWRGLSTVPQHKGAAIRAAPVGANMLEIQLAPKVLFGAETHVGLKNTAAQRGRRRLRRRSSACGPWHDEQRGPCGHQQWIYGHGNQFCGRV